MNKPLLALLLLFLLAVPSPAQSVAEKPPSETAAALVAEALQSYRTGRFDVALEKYTAALKIDPGSADANAGLARVYLRQEKVKEAYDSVTSGTKANPASSTLKTALGEVYFRDGKIAEAEHEFVTVVNSGAKDPRAYLGLARVREAVSLYKSSKNMIDKAHTLDPLDPDIQSFWVKTLSGPERIRQLELYLKGPNDEDEASRESATRYLDLLKARQEHADRKCRLANQLSATETDMVTLLVDARHLRGYGLNVKFNGHNSHLMIDTGATGILVKRSLAEKAGITPLARSKILGIGDKAVPEGYIGYADSIRIGDLEFKDCLVGVSETRSVGEEEGLIGTDVFSPYLVTLDFPQRKLRLTPLPRRPGQESSTTSLGEADPYSTETSDSPKPDSATDHGPYDRYVAPEMANYTKVLRFGHLLVVSTKIGDAPLKLFAIDTGAWTNFISPNAASEVTKVRTDADIIVKGLNGRMKDVYRADNVTIQFARFRQQNQELVAFDTSKVSKSAGTEISGFLGFITLRLFQLKIDYRDGLVDFVYDKDAHR